MSEEKPQSDNPGTVVRGIFADAKPIAIAASHGPELGQPLNGVMPGEWKELADANGLPPDCPVVPLGMQGGTMVLLDALGQIRTLPQPYGKGDILGLFIGRDQYLSWAWDRKNRHGHVEGFDAMKAAACLLRACGGKRIWDGAEKIRGRGVWLSRRGELIVHTGDDLLLGTRSLKVNELDGYVYPARPEIPRPWPESVPPAQMRQLLTLLRTWNWDRKEIDPMLLLGWIGAAWLGGALPFRPAAFLIGDKGTGKSTLQHLLKCLFGAGLVQSADTTAAGIYQHIGQDCLPVAVDELEADTDTRRAKAVLTLARLAASGAVLLRGGDRHQGVEFQARSCFLFSAINTPPMEPANISRMAFLELRKLAPGAPRPVIDPQTYALMGSMIMRRLIDEWPRFSETLAAFQGELAEGAMESRGQDTFGVLLTCADMLLYNGWDEDRLRHDTAEGELVPWRDLMKVDTMVEFEDASENWHGCLNHLLSVQVDAWRQGTRRTVGQVLSEYYDGVDDMGLSHAKLLLGQAGLTITLRDTDRNNLQRPWLAVPNQDPLTRLLFKDSKWAGDVGASVWAGAFRQAPPDLCQRGRARVGGTLNRVTLISLDRLYGTEGIMNES